MTLDLDAIAPLLAPSVGSPEPEGLWDEDVVLALRRLAMQPALRAMEIVEYNPDRDRLGMTADLISNLIEEVLLRVADWKRGSSNVKMFSKSRGVTIGRSLEWLARMSS